MAGPSPNLGPHFSPIHRLAGGDNSEVWLVEDNRFSRRVVAKLLPCPVPDDRIALLEREYDLARRLDHPNVVSMLGYHTHEGQHFLTMEYLPGGNVGRLRGRPLAEIVPVVRQIAGALHHAHCRGVVHRDLKIGNVLLDEAGRPKVADFGIAGASHADPLRPQVVGGGSRFSVSPQQLGENDPEPADDAYALGVLIYELVTGYPPFWPEATADQIRSEVPAPMEADSPIPVPLQNLVADLLAKEPQQRPSLKVAIESLESLEADLVESIAPTPTPLRSPDVRLVPPPRAETVRPIQPAENRLKGSLDGTSPSRRGVPWVTISVVAVLGSALLVVFFLLPNWVERHQTDQMDARAMGQTRVEQPPYDSTSGGPSADRERSRDQAQQALDRVMEQTSSLRARGVERWGGADFSKAAALAAEGDRLLGAGEFGAAVAAYADAEQKLTALDKKADDLLREALDTGRSALDAGDSSTAAEKFRLAATIEPNHPEARQGLRRAEVLDRVLGLVEDGRTAERNGDPRGAARAYREALTLDPQSREAGAGLAAVSSRVEKEAFTAAMSEGLAALDRKEFEAAQDAFRRAASIRPESTEPTEGLKRAEHEQRELAIEGYRRRASKLEEQERWQDALMEYDKALAIDPNVSFARVGKERSLARSRLAERLEYHISHPERLATAQVRDEVSELLTDARAIAPAGPVLTTQIERLEHSIRLATTPVTVELQSDGLTNVVIHRIGPLGTFTRRTHELLPGTYTVLGSRKGYRDVRLELVVTPGGVPRPLVVRCEEEI